MSEAITQIEAKDCAFLVVGSAHLDILGRATGDRETIDRIGNVSIEIGGTACNIALNLRHIGARVSLLTAANASPFSTFVTNHLERKGVTVLLEQEEQLPLAAFSAHIADDGEMLGAISSTAVEYHRFSAEVADAAIEQADCVIVDCNLAVETLQDLAQRACDMLKPLYVAGVSEEKAMRAAAILPFIEGLFLNKREAEYFAKNVLKFGNPTKFAEMADVMQTTLVITDGDRGAYVARPGISSLTHIKPPAIEKVENYLGMGDAFIAGTVFAQTTFDLRLDQAASLMLPFVADIALHSSCNASGTNVIESMLSELRQHASTCPTTHILNRASIEEQLGRLIEMARSTSGTGAIALIDVDHFKQINDTYGHNTGDHVLMVVADSIRSVLRNHDSVGRWGGDEFVVMIQGDESAAMKVAERIRNATTKACSHIAPVTLSIGVAEWGPGMTSSSDLIAAADGALYRVKENGRNGAMAASQSGIELEPSGSG